MTHDFYSVNILERPKGLLTHMGLEFPNGLVLHNTPEKGEHFSSIEEFAAGHVSNKKPVQLSPEQFNTVWSRACNIVQNPKKYGPFINNCEHTLTRALTGVPSSNQLNGVAILTFLVIAAKLALR